MLWRLVTLGLGGALAFLCLTVWGQAGEARQHEFNPDPHAIGIPSWFNQIFLDFPEDVREAAKAGRRVMLYFGQDGCPYCMRLMESV